MFTKTLSTTLSAIVIPAAALLIALSPGVAAADSGGPVLLVVPNTSVVAGVEVAGALSSGMMLNCIFTDSGVSVQTCVLPAGTGPNANDANNANDASVAVAGVTADAMGNASFTCLFDASISGPQTCAING